MDFLSYKTFVWPHNPHTYKEEYIREPKFRTENGITSFCNANHIFFHQPPNNFFIKNSPEKMQKITSWIYTYSPPYNIHWY